MKDILVIGIAGGTASGKTTLANKIKEMYDDHLILLCHDYYYKANKDLSLKERKKLNYDHPNAFDTNLMIEHVKDLKNGKTIHHPVYSFVEHTRLDESVKVEPTKVIIIEGILIFENKELTDLMDIKVFVDTDADVRFIRRLVRDVKTRGRDLDNVIEQYLMTVKPMHEEFVETSKKNADIIVPKGGYNTVALAMLTDMIDKILKS